MSNVHPMVGALLRVENVSGKYSIRISDLNEGNYQAVLELLQVPKFVPGEEPMQAMIDAARQANQPQASLVDAVRALYYAGVWKCDRPVNEAKLWTDVRDAAGFEPGHSPQPQENEIPGLRDGLLTGTKHETSEAITCEQCGKMFSHYETTAYARFDFCSLWCEAKYRTEHPERPSNHTSVQRAVTGED